MKKTLFIFIMCLLPVLAPCKPWLILANGPEIPEEELKEFIQNRTLLALDGAVNRLRTIPLHPDIILGDFDSIEDPAYWGIVETFADLNEQSSSYQGNFGITIVPAKDQNYTDLEKAIMYCDRIEKGPILILQATGRRMDHTLGNLGLLRKHYQQDRPLIIRTEIEQILFLRDEKISIENGVGGTCAILGYPQAVMTTTGLAYNGEGYPLILGIQESVCNTITEPTATITIQGEALIILPKAATFYKN